MVNKIYNVGSKHYVSIHLMRKDTFYIIWCHTLYAIFTGNVWDEQNIWSSKLEV